MALAVVVVEHLPELVSGALVNAEVDHLNAATTQESPAGRRVLSEWNSGEGLDETYHRDYGNFRLTKSRHVPFAVGPFLVDRSRTHSANGGPSDGRSRDG